MPFPYNSNSFLLKILLKMTIPLPRPMAMHIAIGLGKRIVLFNNIFNRNEFELYGKGIILEPSRPCRCFYHPVCTNKEYRCMEYLSVQQAADACRRLFA